MMNREWAHRLSLIAATTLALAITIYPRALMKDGVSLDHGLLSLLMLGMSAGFVHGFGFTPDNRYLRILLGAFVAWPLLLAGWALIIRNYFN
jgi:predicted membrane protein